MDPQSEYDPITEHLCWGKTYPGRQWAAAFSELRGCHPLDSRTLHPGLQPDLTAGEDHKEPGWGGEHPGAEQWCALTPLKSPEHLSSLNFTQGRLLIL